MNWRDHLKEWLSPMTLAAIAAWLAVWFSLGRAWRDFPAGAIWIHAATLLFLLVFLAEHWLGRGLSRFRYACMALVLAALALVPIATVPFSAAPILLVLWAAMLAAHYEGRVLWSWLIVVNLIAGGLMVAFWPSQKLMWVTWLGYFSFQAFATIVMRYAAQAEAMSQQLREVNAELLATRHLLEAGARDQERLRLARELHDVAGHKLTALKLNLSAMQLQAEPASREAAQACEHLAAELLTDIRAVVAHLRAHEGMDVREAIELLARAFPRPRIELELADDAKPSDARQAEAIVRAVQEALTNCAKHSTAEILHVRLQRERDQLHLHISDNGHPVPALCVGHGLMGMRERFELLGGQWRIDTPISGGVQLHAALPMRS